MLVSIRVIVSCCVLIMSVLFAVHVQAENSKPAKKIPKWKQEHMARVANAAKVCGSPTLKPIVKPNDLTTNYYQVNLMPDEMGLYLDVEDGKPTFVNSSGETQDWLLSRVGEGLYKVSACVNETPLCLTTTVEKKITLAACNEFGYGDQVWWIKGYAVGVNKGGWFLGNDGVGQMECLIVGESDKGLGLQTCTNEQSGWRFNLTSQVNKAGGKGKSKSVLLGFPNGAEVIEYQCNSGASVQTYYDVNKDEMMVRYNEQILNLKPVISGSGEKYGDANQPLGWWAKGNVGFIFQSQREDAVLENCLEIDASHKVNLPAREWEAQDFGDGATVADCTDCEEDLGLLMTCGKDTHTAQVTAYMDVPLKTKGVLLEVAVGNQIFQYPFETQYHGMTDEHVALFEIHKNDSILPALQQAKNVTFNVGSDVLTIGLAGSKKAISKFKNFCGW